MNPFDDLDLIFWTFLMMLFIYLLVSGKACSELLS